jgi:hypothetical protein
VVAEPVLVGDHDAAALELRQVHLERRGVHGDEHVGLSTRREDVPRRKVDLERGDAGECPGRGADLGGEVGKGDEVVADQRGGCGEAVAG